MKIFPDSEKTRVIFVSSAEESLYENSRKQLSENWRVYYSCSLSEFEGEEGLRDNEIDFVFYHPDYGIFVAEVKGGRIKFDAQKQKFSSLNRHGEIFSIKDPFKQVLVWKSRFLRFLKKNGIRVPVSHLVCFPGAHAKEFPKSAAMNPAIILDREGMDQLEEFLIRLARSSHPEHFFKFSDVGEKLDRILIGKTFTSRLYIRDYIDSHEKRVRDVESVFDSLLTPVTSQSRLGIEGEAGTGKTMLALLIAKFFRDRSERILFLSSNPILNLFLRQEAGDGISVETFADIAEKFGVSLLNPPASFQGKRSDWIQIEGPVLLKEAIVNNKNFRFDVIVCDEAQDVQPFWWEAFEELLAGSESRLYLFFDRSQGIFGSGGSDKKFDPDTTLPISPPFFPLVNNYRTTREISTFARSFRTGGSVLQSHCGRLGYIPEIVTYEDQEDWQRQIGKIVRNLVKTEKVQPIEITFLSARAPDSRESVLAGVREISRIPLHKLTYNKKNKWRQTRPPRGHMAVATISAFKGLETKIGFLINISEYNLPVSNPIMASLIYVACTRAKHMLYICVRKNDPKRKAIEEALAEVRAKGALVLEGSDKDFEFNGKISHYNPARVGWISVEDAGFQKNSIMFFPFDVEKSGLTGKIKVGKRIKFRPKMEGQVSIACDLKLLD